MKAQDLRGATGMQDFVAAAPLNLVYVEDFARMPDASAEERGFFAGADSGCIAQNVYLYCPPPDWPPWYVAGSIGSSWRRRSG